MITSSNILNLLSLNESIEQKKLERALKLTKKGDKLKLDIAIKAFEKLNIIDVDESKNIKLNSDDSNIRAKIRCSSKGFCFAVPESGEDDIYIREHFLNHAWNGDSVLVKVTKQAERRRSPEGVVQCILRRNTKSLICLIKEQDNELIATPLDDRLIEDIQLNKNDRRFLKANDNIVEVIIRKYPLAQYPALGEVVRELPLNSGTKGDLDILLTKSNLQTELNPPKALFNDLSGSTRTDLTHQPSLVLSSWKDSKAPLLPAIHVENSHNGTRLWIHSPAIAERFTIGGKFDSWLKERGESICLGNNWRQLHNEELNDLCSFTPNKINEAVSLCIDIDNDGSVTHWEFHLSKIKPIAIISPTQLESINNRKPKARTIPKILQPIKEQINQVKTILFLSDLLNSKKQHSIELDIEIPEISTLSELALENPGSNFEGWERPLNLNDPNSVINIFLNIANTIWFIHSKRYNMNTIVTEKCQLDLSTLNEVVKSAISLNISVELDDNGYVNPKKFIKSINEYDNSSIFLKIIKQIVTDKNIIYSDSINIDTTDYIYKNQLHSQKYQSPWCNASQSYLNLINQYLLVILLKEGKSKEKSRSKNSINLGELNSWDNLKWPLFSNSVSGQISSLLSKELIENIQITIQNKCLFYRNLLSMTKSREALLLLDTQLEGLITGVQSYGFFAEIPPLMIEGLVHVSTLSDDWYEYRSRQNLLIGRKSKKTYQLGDKVNLKISKVDLLRNQIDLVIIDSYESLISETNA